MKIFLLLCAVVISYNGHSQVAIVDDKSKSFDIGKADKICTVSLHFDGLSLNKTTKFSIGYTARNPFAALGTDFSFADDAGKTLPDATMDVTILNKAAKFSIMVAGNFKGKKTICIDTYFTIDDKKIPNTIYIDVIGNQSENVDRSSQTVSGGSENNGALELVSLDKIQVYTGSDNSKDHLINIESPDPNETDNTITIRSINLKVNETYKGTIDFTNFLANTNKLYLNGDPNGKFYVFARDVVNYIAPSSKSSTKKLSRENKSVPFSPKTAIDSSNTQKPNQK